MDVFEAISQRRSIRKFKDKDVDDTMILQIIQGGIWAPSAGNLQSWEIILVKNPETKKNYVKLPICVILYPKHR
ncbi:hypothetical protein GCM10025860_03370 [Methanobacterium ferruginis]|nr:nitroreductase family protein [Methanobacterium ferruginis]BDZ66889.1 hypothetical protein GCM10025860_03370 [Methanobacterium ferruginis]